jgi:hypothetical protein
MDPMKKRIVLALMLALAAVLVVACQGAAPEVTEAPVATEAAAPVLEVVGPAGSRSLTLTELEALPTVEGWAGIKSSTGVITPPARFRGVALQELASLVGGLTPDFGISVVAEDGYAMTFSYDQIVNNDFITYDPMTGGEVTLDQPLTVALAFESNGQPLPVDTDGTLRLVVLSPENNQVVDGHWSVKWVNRIVVETVAEAWSLHLEGALTEDMDRGTFEAGASPSCHQASWTDDQGQVYTGIPLWLLVGSIDDADSHGDQAFNEALAAQGYTVDIVAADGYSVTLESSRFTGQNGILVAYLLNGEPLPEDESPLRLVGADLQRNEQESRIASIIFHQPSSAAPTGGALPTAAPGEEALTISGAVANPLSLSLEGLRTMEVVQLTAEHPRHGATDYEGVRLNALLDAAAPSPEAVTLVLTASDGFSAEVPLADVRACTDCLLAFETDGTLTAVMPGMASNLWVKQINSLEVQ